VFNRQDPKNVAVFRGSGGRQHHQGIPTGRCGSRPVSPPSEIGQFRLRNRFSKQAVCASKHDCRRSPGSAGHEEYSIVGSATVGVALACVRNEIGAGGGYLEAHEVVSQAGE